MKNGYINLSIFFFEEITIEYKSYMQLAWFLEFAHHFGCFSGSRFSAGRAEEFVALLFLCDASRLWLTKWYTRVLNYTCGILSLARTWRASFLGDSYTGNKQAIHRTDIASHCSPRLLSSVCFSFPTVVLASRQFGHSEVISRAQHHAFNVLI